MPSNLVGGSHFDPACLNPNLKWNTWPTRLFPYQSSFSLNSHLSPSNSIWDEFFSFNNFIFH